MTAWHAALTLDYRREHGRSVLAQRHHGPLQVQKPLYPEGGDVCHTILIHPPGGIAGGDALAIDVTAHESAQALITTPGATKWYKANGRQAEQRVTLRVRGGLEWLPQETIVFDAAEARSEIDIELDGDASMLGWDIVALGRAACGETFSRGAFSQTIRLREDNKLQWIERTRIAGGDALLDSPIGLAGRHVFGCLWAIGPCWSDAHVESVRARLPADRTAALSRLAPRLLVARALTATTQAARRALEAVWHELRPRVFAGRDARTPRIWVT